MASRSRAVVAQAALVAAALTGTACNAILGPSAPDTNWHVYDSVRFSLYSRPSSFAELNAPRLADVLEDQYTHTLDVLDVRYGRRISAFLYQSAADAGREFERSGTGYPDTGAFGAVCTAPLDDNLFFLLSHEANHVLIRGALGQPGTYLANEGLATAVLSERFHQLGRHSLYSWTRTHRAQIPPLADLAADDQWNNRPQEISYNASASFLAYLLDTYGPQPLKQIYYARSSEFADRVRSAYGRSLQDLEADWLRFCADWTG